MMYLSFRNQQRSQEDTKHERLAESQGAWEAEAGSATGQVDEKLKEEG